MYTTKLLAIIDDAMPRRSRIVLAAIVAFLVIMSIADALSRRPAQTAVQAPVLVIVTATPGLRPARSVGLAKEAAALVRAPASPTAAPTLAPTIEPVVLVVVAPPEPTAAPAPTATLVPPWIGTRWTAR